MKKCRNKYCPIYNSKKPQNCEIFWYFKKHFETCTDRTRYERDFPVKPKPKLIINVRQYLAEIEKAHKKTGKSKLVFKRGHEK